LPAHPSAGRIEFGKKIEKSFGVARAISAVSESGFVACFFGEFGDATIKPPAERTEPKGSAMKERETLCERIAALDVRDLVSHHGIELGIVPISPSGGKQNTRAAHSECDGHEHNFGFGEAWQFLEPDCARMIREAAEHARVVDGSSGALQPAGEKETQQEAREEDGGDGDVNRSSDDFQPGVERLCADWFRRALP
jgi:hypothetical protein